MDYLPTKPIVLFGHHYASIAGLAPVLGPAVAVIWGWLPAMIWVVFGSIFVGCVHDFGALVVSVRNQGKSIGQVAEDLLGHRARSLFHAIIFFLVALAMGVFVLVLAEMFSADPKAHLKSADVPVEEKKTSATAIEVTKKSDLTGVTRTLTSGSKTPNEKVHDHPGEIRTEEKPSIRLRSHFPEAVIPSAAIMVFAVIMGYLHYKKGIN